MNKLFFTSLFLLFSSLSFFGQKRDYLAEMYANHHGIAQKAGTNDLLKDFIKPYGKKGEVFAILFAPQACPRCEVDIPYVLENLPKIKPQAELVIIAAYHDSILEAIRLGDADRAANYMDEHLKKVEEALREHGLE